MKRRPLAALAALALGLALLAGCAASAAPVATGHRVATVCSWLQDGDGTGSAISATPGHAPSGGGQAATMQSFTGGAWQVCYNGGSGNIWLLAAHTWCLTWITDNAAWRPCGADNGQVWNTYPQPGGGAEYRNFAAGPTNGADACAGGGVGSKVVMSPRSLCSTYHRTFLFHQVRKQPAALPAVTTRGAYRLAA